MPSSRIHRIAAIVALVCLLSGGARAQDNGAEEMPGVGPHSIRIGNTDAYSGPAAAYSSIGRGDAAYFKMINEQGGVNGRTIDFLSVDDGYDLEQTLAATKRLVETEHVALMFNALGTPTNLAVQPYMNERGVPQLFIASGADRWADPKGHPWTMGWQPSYRIEARIYARYIGKERPNAKIAILYQDDDFGRDYLAGVKDVLGDQYDSRVVTAPYKVTDPAIVKQAAALKASGATVLITAATPKFATQMIRRVHDMGWRPMQFLTNVSISVGTVIDEAGPEAASGIMTAAFLKDPSDPAWKHDPGMIAYEKFLKQYLPQAQASDAGYEFGYGASMTLIQVLKQCGGDLSRGNIMRQAANLHALEIPVLLPGIKVETSPTDFHPISEMQLARWTGHNWKVFGPVMGAHSP